MKDMVELKFCLELNLEKKMMLPYTYLVEFVFFVWWCRFQCYLIVGNYET